jgi:hypothetical protein
MLPAAFLANRRHAGAKIPGATLVIAPRREKPITANTARECCNAR